MDVFDIREQSWVPVLDGGRTVDVSLREALSRAGEVGGLASSPPTMTIVLLRVLLAVVLDAEGAPRSKREWVERWDAGGFSSAVDEYLDRHRDRFDLFSSDAPFAQAPRIEAPRGETKPSSMLIISEPTGNNVPVFGTRTEADTPTLTPAEAVRWLLHTLAWDVGGIKPGLVDDPQAKAGKGYGNPTGPLGGLGCAYPVGQNLFETLMLNLPILQDGLAPDDAPAWRAEPPGPAWRERSPRGLLDLLTWPSRRIRLVPEATPDGTVVRSLVLGGGDRILGVQADTEPHSLWRFANATRGQEPGWRPRRLPSGRATWEGLDALLAFASASAESELRTSFLLEQIQELRLDGHLDPSYPLSVAVCGCEYGNMSAVVENIVADALPLPVAAFDDPDVRELLLDMATASAKLINDLNSLADDLRRAAGGDPIPWDKGQRPGTLLVPRLDPHVRRVLTGLQRDPDRVDDARRAWFTMARRIARDLADELLRVVPPEARTGRDIEVDNRPARRFNAAIAERDFRIRMNRDLEDFEDDPQQEVG
jgi:CRISPR system Cascade subunit CasA